MRTQVCQRVLVKTCNNVVRNGHHEKLCYSHHITKCVLSAICEHSTMIIMHITVTFSLRMSQHTTGTQAGHLASAKARLEPGPGVAIA